MVRPELLSESAVVAIVRAALGAGATDELCAAVWAASGGNPLYLTELLRAGELEGRPLAELDPAELVAGGREGVARRVLAGVRGLDRCALPLAQALAVLGDGCELRHAAAIAGVEVSEAISLAAGLVRLEVLASRRSSALYSSGCPRCGRGLVGERRARRPASLRRPPAARRWGPAGAGRGASGGACGRRAMAGCWTRLREAARAAMQSGAPGAAAGLLGRALVGAAPERAASRRSPRGRPGGGERRARDGVRAAGGGAAPGHRSAGAGRDRA